MRLIPGKTKVRVELFKGISLTDMLIAFIAALLVVFILTSTLPGKIYMVIGVIVIAGVLLVRLDTEPNYMYLLHILRHLGYRKEYERMFTDDELKNKTLKGKTQFAIDLLTSDDDDYDDYGYSRSEYRSPREEQDGEEHSGESDEELPAAQDERLVLHRPSDGDDRSAAASQPEKKPEPRKRSVSAVDMSEIISFTGIKDGYIEYGTSYYGVALEIPPVEFRFFSQNRRDNSIDNALGRVLRSLPSEYSANIIKIERPVIYDEYLANEYKKLDALKATYERGIISEEELQARVEILYDRIYELRSLCFEDKVVQPFYYIVLFDSNKTQLDNALRNALTYLSAGEINARQLDDKELAIFLKYTYQLDFDEREIDSIQPEDYAEWAKPESVMMTPRTVKINKILTHNLRVVNYPGQVGDAWLAGVMTIPGTKVVVKCRPMDKQKSIRTIDRSLQELRGQLSSTGIDSKIIELQSHIETLSSLLALLQGDNEALLSVNIYVTAYDILQTEAYYKDVPENSALARVTNMKRVVRRIYSESNLRLNNMEFEQVEAFIGSQVSGWDPCFKDGRGMPSSSLAACYPWIFSHVSDPNGICLGSSDGVPVFIDFFRRDSERVNSNMVIVGKSGSGKSYATKSLLANLASENSKIFILDPENEYSELAENLHGKFINVGNAQYGRLNPFHIITSLGDDEADDGQSTGSYATHLQFLEEFFRQILPDCEKDAMEYLNSLIDRMYTNMGITTETNLSRLKPEDYPTFDDLYDAILSEFQSTENDYIRTMLRTLMNYISKFSSGGRNSNIWNGPSTVTTDENFTVFNFQSLLANRNGAIANAQMLLVLKYIDNEIIKNRDYNTKYSLNRKIVVVIDEAHVFIDTKYPVALDFMFQLAKRIRKYNGMQIVITQNIKDFVGSEEIARKSTAIINACQYSFIFSLSPNDMDDLCKLYEKAGGINENEQEQIVSAPRGQAFTVMSPQSRSSFKIEVPGSVVEMFEHPGYTSQYFTGEGGVTNWESFVAESRARRVVKALPEPELIDSSADDTTAGTGHVTFVEMDEEDYLRELAIEEADADEAKLAAEAEEAAKAARFEALKAERAAEKRVSFVEFTEETPEPEVLFTEILPEETEVTPAASEPVVVSEPEPVQPVPAPVPAAPVQPVYIPVPAPQPAPASSTTERLLSDLLARFSHDSLVDEIRRSVREEVEKEMNIIRDSAPAAQPALYEPEPVRDSAPVEIPAPAEVPEPAPADDITDEDAAAFTDMLFGSLGETENENESEAESFDSGILGSIFDTDSLFPSDEDDTAGSSLFDTADTSDASGTSDTSDSLFDLFGSSSDDSGDDDSSGFDLMQIIMEQAENMSDVSPIDMMLDYGDTELEITLEELAQYNLNQRKNKSSGGSIW